MLISPRECKLQEVEDRLKGTKNDKNKQIKQKAKRYVYAKKKDSGAATKCQITKAAHVNLHVRKSDEEYEQESGERSGHNGHTRPFCLYHKA